MSHPKSLNKMCSIIPYDPMSYIGKFMHDFFKIGCDRLKKLKIPIMQLKNISMGLMPEN
jgi:hypothetical protein